MVKLPLETIEHLKPASIVGFFMQTIVTNPIAKFADLLASGTKIGQAQIDKVMNAAYGSSANGNWNWAQAFDSIEAAMSSYLLARPLLSLGEPQNSDKIVS
jgi:hypothetical protein